MYIHEAIQKLGQDGYLTRKNAWWGKLLKIKPTDTEDCCVIISPEGAPGKKWNPRREDLMANDWEIVTDELENLNSGKSSINEIRKQHGLPPIKEGDCLITTKEEDKWKNDLIKARKNSRQAQWISLIALVLSAVALIIRLIVVLQ